MNAKIKKSILLAMLFLPGWAFAACSHGYGGNFPMPANISAANISNTAIEGVIFSHQAVFAYNFGVVWWFTCSETVNGVYPYEIRPTGSLVKGNIYRSSDPRIGLRVAWGGKMLPILNGRAINGGFVDGPFLRMLLPERFQPMVVELIKLDNINSPVTLSGPFATIEVPGNGINVASIHFQNPVVVAPPQPPTCRPIRTSISVPMGPAPITRFTGVGATAGDMNFNIVLMCGGGNDNLSVAALVSLSDAVNAANTTDRLDLTRDSAARGIGVQVLRGGQPLRFGANSPGNPWQAGTAQGGSPSVLQIPLRARYVQTANAVVAGTANARATVTFSYR